MATKKIHEASLIHGKQGYSHKLLFSLDFSAVVIGQSGTSKGCLILCIDALD